MVGDAGRPVGNVDDPVNLPDAEYGLASMIVCIVAEMMATYLLFDQFFVISPQEFTKLCTSMAKGIDRAIANGEYPRKARLLPPLLMLVYRARENEDCLLDLMLLTLSVQCACKLDWFTYEEVEAFQTVFNEVTSKFADPDLFRIEPSGAAHCLLYVASRYYPGLQIDNFLFTVLLQPGCRLCAASIPITTTMVSLGDDQICLFAIQVDNLDSLACTFTPATVNIEINFVDIRERITLSEYGSIQYPIDVTDMLKLGVNCLQTFGQTEGNLLLVLAVTSEVEPYAPVIISPYLPYESGETPEQVRSYLLNSPASSYHGISDPTRPSSQNHLCQDQPLSSRVRSLIAILIDEEVARVMESILDDADDQEDHLGLIQDYVLMTLLAESDPNDFPYNDQDHQEDMDNVMQSFMDDDEGDGEVVDDEDRQAQPTDSAGDNFMGSP